MVLSEYENYEREINKTSASDDGLPENHVIIGQPNYSWGE